MDDLYTAMLKKDIEHLERLLGNIFEAYRNLGRITNQIQKNSDRLAPSHSRWLNIKFARRCEGRTLQMKTNIFVNVENSCSSLIL